jgi:hypothetical protein
MYKASDYFKEGKKIRPLTKFMWWAAGADRKLLMRCSYSDHAKYFGLGGIVVATGMLAAISGGYAFYTIFSPKEIQGALTDVTDFPTVIKATIFGIIWGLIIFNLDRFVISSTGKGDGTEKITKDEFVNALPRIVMALILSIAIAAPLEIRIFKTEIDAELFKIQKEKIQELNDITDARFAERIKDATANREKLEKDIAQLEVLIKDQEIKLQEEIAGRVGSGKDGYGPAAKQIELYIKKLEKKKQELDSRNQKKIANLEVNIQELKKKRDEEYIENNNQAKKLDGLLQRIKLAEDIAGWKIIWLIRMIFIVIETGPIFFKMMVIKSSYDYLEENLKEEIKARAGIIASSEVHLDKDGNEIIEYTYATSKQIIDDKIKLLEAQNELSQYVVDKWKEKEKEKIDKNPDDYIKTIES